MKNGSRRAAGLRRELPLIVAVKLLALWLIWWLFFSAAEPPPEVLREQVGANVFGLDAPR